MKTYDKIKDMLCDELEEIAKKKELTSSNLEVLDKAVDIIKDIDTIKAMEMEYPEGYSEEGGYSQDGNSYWGRYPFYMYEGGGSSYARGRGSNASRDSRGRYSSEGYSRNYSNEGYSGDTKEELQRIMSMAQNDREREAIRKALDSMNR